MFLVTEYDPIYFLMPALLNSSNITSKSKAELGSGVFQTLEQILSNSLHNELEEIAFQPSPGSDVEDRPKPLKQVLLNSDRLQRSIKKVCQTKKIDAIGSAPPMCLFQFS